MLHLLADNPWTVVVALLLIAATQLYIYRGASWRLLEECFIFSWWDALLGLIMPSAAQDGVCEACGAHAHLRCARCKLVRYCSLECQRRHWRAGHRGECGKPRVQLTEEELAARRASLEAKLTEPYPAAEYIIFSYDKYLQLLRDEEAYLPEDLSAADLSPPVGLFNVGNTCYANSVLQCLFATPSFCGFLFEFMRWKAHQDAHKGEPQHDSLAVGASWSLLEELSSLLHVAMSSATPVSPKPLLSRIGRIGRHLTFGRQEDSHDFLLTLLDAMETELLQLAGGKDTITDSRTRETTYVFHTFGGYMRNQVLCCECEYRSKRFESSVCLNLEIPGHISTLEAALGLHCAEEALEGLNKYQCDCCHNKVRAIKSSRLEAAPNVLVLALKRFAIGRFGKLNKKIAYPQTLDISEYRAEGSIDPGPQVYSLYAVLVHLDHMNSTSFGHYVAYVKHTEDDRWFLCDDSRVTQVTATKALSQNAYMLFYARDPAEPKAEPLIKQPQVEPAAAADVDISESEKPPLGQHQMLPPQEDVPAPAAVFHHGFAHGLMDPGSVMERTFSSPAVLNKLGHSNGHLRPTSLLAHNSSSHEEDSPFRVVLPVCSTSSSDSGISGIAQEGARASVEVSSPLAAPGGDIEEESDRMQAPSRFHAAAFSDGRTANPEGEHAGQQLPTPQYWINTSQDHEDGPQMVELLVDLPGAESRELDVYTEKVPVDATQPGGEGAGPSQPALRMQVVVTVVVEGKYELRVPLGLDVEPMLHPAKFSKKTGRLRVLLVASSPTFDVSKLMADLPGGPGNELASNSEASQ